MYIPYKQDINFITTKILIFNILKYSVEKNILNGNLLI